MAVEQSNEPMLKLNKVSKHFGGLAAVQDLDLEVKPREIISVIGPNGAGKTTVFNLITGIYSPTSGNIVLAGRSLAGLSPDKVLRRGIARTFQNIRLFNNMTILENVLVGEHTQLKANVLGSLFHTPNVMHEEAEARQRAVELLSFFGTELVERQEEYVINPSYGQRRRVQVARALGCIRRLLIPDEPTAGMHEAGSLDAVKYVRRLRD